MMRLVLILVILNLCAINSGAQVKIASMTKDSCQCLANSNLVDSIKEKARLEKFFRLRTVQRMHQIDNDINFISKNSDSAKVEYYKRQILALFDIEAKVIMKWKRKAKSIGIKSFLDKMASREIILKSIDSIRVPVWNYELVKENVSDSVFSKSEMRPFRLQQKFGNEDNPLAIIKENTEDGDEWIPLFGDIVVTVKKYKKQKKEMSL